jgi:hypothetical protein
VTTAARLRPRLAAGRERYNRLMSARWPDEQPIARTVGRRKAAPVGVPPSREARSALDSFACRLTRAPKGVFRYASHEEMARDRELWTAQAMAEIARERG